MEWFREEWLNSDAGALGVYLALLYIRFENHSKKWVKEKVSEEINKFSLTGKDKDEALRFTMEFIESIYSHYPINNDNGYFANKKLVNADLELLEEKYYERFKKACYKYFKQNIIKNYYNREIALFLKGVKEKGFDKTACGSIHNVVVLYYIMDYVEDDKKAEAIEQALIDSRIVWFNKIIPAPYLDDEFLTKLEKEDILESIVAEVLEKFGFNVKVNAELESKKGKKMRVDVWGFKTIEDIKYYVYASCKNWKNKINEDVIFSEIGKITNLVQYPHLKILICNKLADSAREIALKGGFIVIELKEKANSENIEEITKLIYNYLNKLFTGIAPPELQRIAKKTKDITEKLKSLVDELDKLTK